MPKIDVYTAPADQFRAPALGYTQSGENPAAAKIQQQSQLLGHEFAVIGGHIEAQTADLQFLQMQGDRQTGEAALVQDLQRDPEVIANPQLFEVKYQQGMAAVEQSISSNPNYTSEQAKAHYSFYRGMEEPKDFIKARGVGLKLQDSKNQGDFLIQKDKISLEAASAPTEEDFNQSLAKFTDLVITSTNNHALTPKQGEAELVSFRRQTAEQNMAVVGSRNPTQMREMLAHGSWPDDVVPPLKKEQILEHVNTKERVEQNAIQAQAEQIRKQYVNETIEPLANFGRVPEWMITRGLQGLDPIHKDASDWVRIQKLNQEAPGLSAGDTNGMRASSAIRLVHGLNPNPTKEDAQKALAEIADLQKQGGQSQKALDHMRMDAEHFQGAIKQYDSAELAAQKYESTQLRVAEATAQRNKTFEDSQLTKKIHSAKVLMENEMGKRPLNINSIIGSMERSKRQYLLIQLENTLRKNPGMSDAEVSAQIGALIDKHVTKPDPNDPINQLFAPRQ